MPPAVVGMIRAWATIAAAENTRMVDVLGRPDAPRVAASAAAPIKMIVQA
jgi:hypothetical protein